MAFSTEVILILLQLKGIGSKTIINLANQLQTPINSFDQLSQLWPSLTGKVFTKFSLEDLAQAEKKAQSIIAQCKQEGVGLISFYDANFPQSLRECVDEDGKLKPPVLLYYRGHLEALQQHAVAFIGTRTPTVNGIKAGKYFAEQFAAKGFNIVSGLALGCDTAGHEGALAAGGITTAFLANGLDWASIFPRENLDLAQRIVANNGLLLSEYPVGQPCSKHALVARDRLQAGLACATIVIQTRINGGTMHAVNATISANKPLFAVEYKNAADLADANVQGNLKLCQNKQAMPLRLAEIEDAISKCEATYHNQPSLTEAAESLSTEQAKSQPLKQAQAEPKAESASKKVTAADDSSLKQGMLLDLP